MTEYEAGYLAHAAEDLQFRQAQEAAAQKRHEEAQAYGARALEQAQAHHAQSMAARLEQEAAAQKRHQETQAYGTRLLEVQERHHAESMAARAKETAGQNARATAEKAVADAAIEAAAAQRYAADKLTAPTFDNLLTAAIARLDDRTGTGKANIPLAVTETLDTHAELANRLAAASARPAPPQ